MTTAAERVLDNVAPPTVAEPERGLRFCTPRELRRIAPQDPPWVWDGYLARGWLTVVGGRPKVGKSTVLFAAVEAIANGAELFLGRSVATGPVVIVTEEGATTAIAKLPDVDDILVLTRENAWPKPSWSELVTSAVSEAKRISAVLLLVDSFAFWSQLAADAEKDSGAVQHAFDPLIEATQAGLAVGLVHHQRKSGGEDGDALRGSGAIAANADAILEIERLDEDAPPRHRRLVAVSRMPEATPPLLVVDYDPRDASWRVVGEGEGRADSTRVAWRERILDALPRDEPGVTYDDLSEALSADKRKWAGALNALVSDRLASRVGGGRKGDPYRFRTVPQDSVPGFRPGSRTERDGNDPDDQIRIPSFPLRGTESNRSTNGNKDSIRSEVGDGNEADAELERITAKFGPLGVNDRGEEMAF